MNLQIMTKQYAADLVKFAPILKAYSEGKTIQIRSKGSGTWRDDTSYFFDEGSISAASDIEYRIKPAAREYWIRLKSSSTVDAEVFFVPPFNTTDFKEVLHVKEVA